MEDDDGSTSIQMYLKPLNCTLKRGSKDKFYAMSLYSSTESQWDILTEKLKKKKKKNYLCLVTTARKEGQARI